MGMNDYKKTNLERHHEGEYCNVLSNVHVGICAVEQEKLELPVGLGIPHGKYTPPLSN